MVYLLKLRRRTLVLLPWIAYCFWWAYRSNRARIDREFSPAAADRYGSLMKAAKTMCRVMWSPKPKREVFAVMCNLRAVGPLTLIHDWVVDLPDGGQVRGTNIAYWWAARNARPRAFQERLLCRVLRRVDTLLVERGFTGILWTVVRSEHEASAGPLRNVLGMETEGSGMFPELHTEPAGLLRVTYPRPLS